MTTEQQTPPSATEPPAQTDPAPVNQPGTESAPSEEAKKLANDQLRDYANRLETENKDLRQLAMRSSLAEIGLSPTEGLGVAIVESYKGEITDDAIAAYAAEKYKHGAQVQPQEQPVVTAASQIEQLTAAGESVIPTPQATPGEQVIAKVDSGSAEVTSQEALLSLNQKAGQFVQEHYGTKQ